MAEKIEGKLWRKNLSTIWEPARPLQRSLGPFRPEIPKKSRKCLPGPPAPEPRKVSKIFKSLGNNLGSLPRVSGKCRKSLFGLFARLFGDFSGFPGRRPRETFYETFSAFRARRARETSVRGGLVHKSTIPKRGLSKRHRTQKHANESKRAQMCAKGRKRKSAEKRN